VVLKSCRNMELRDVTELEDFVAVDWDNSVSYENDFQDHMDWDEHDGREGRW